MWKQQHHVFFFMEIHCFSNLYWDVKWCWMRDHIYVSGSLSAQWTATDTQSISYYQSYQSDIKWLFHTCVKMQQGSASLNTTWSGVAVSANRSRERPATGRSCSHTRFQILALHSEECKSDKSSCSCTLGSANQTEAACFSTRSSDWTSTES